MNDNCINICGPIYDTGKTLTDNDLYHYTSADSFFKIMESYSLKTSKFERLNDLNEGNFSDIGNLSINLNERILLEKYVKYNCNILCFSQNYRHNGVNLESTAFSTMWAYYAQNHTGVCIVVNKDQFIRKNNIQYQPVIHGNVEYLFNPKAFKYDFDLSIKCPREFIKLYNRELLFKKSLDWLHESEYRFLCLDNSKLEYLSIEGCIDHIVLGNRFFDNKENEQKLIDLLLCNSDFLNERSLNPLSFTQVHPNGVGFSEHLIEYKLQEIATRYRDFQNYLNEWYNLM